MNEQSFEKSLNASITNKHSKLSVVVFYTLAVANIVLGVFVAFATGSGGVSDVLPILIVPIFLPIILFFISLTKYFDGTIDIKNVFTIFGLSYIPFILVGIGLLDTIGWDSFIFIKIIGRITIGEILIYSPLLITPMCIIYGHKLSKREP